MHTFKYPADLDEESFANNFSEDATIIHHHGDFSGNAIINRPGEKMIAVPCAALISFVAELVRSNRMGNLEEMTDSDLLGIPGYMTETDAVGTDEAGA